MLGFLFFKQTTAYEMRMSDWSSDVCSSDLRLGPGKIGARSVETLIAARLPVLDTDARGAFLAARGLGDPAYIRQHQRIGGGGRRRTGEDRQQRGGAGTIQGLHLVHSSLRSPGARHPSPPHRRFSTHVYLVRASCLEK